jgi:hypothetical protein
MTDETTPQDDAAMSPASTGSVAWQSLGMISDERLKSLMEQVGMPNSRSLKEALMQCDKEARLDASSRLSLTDAEREAIKEAISCCEDITYGGAADQEAADVLKALLERLK